MSTFTVNGVTISTTKTGKLLTFLRDDLRLTSVKNACSEGSCGSCTVIMDGKAVRSCITTIEKADGHDFLTTEGLTQREKEVYCYAFKSCGAVQCGFCIPGMVLAAKALIDKNPDPTMDDVKNAINRNICRCTGYVKIEKAILLAAKMFREDMGIEEPVFTGLLGESMFRVDAEDKVLGTANYADDLFFDDMLYAGVVRCPHPRAKVVSIDTSAAEALPGVIKVATADDIPGAHVIGYIFQDWPVLFGVGEITMCIGDAIVAIAAETKDILEEAKKLVKIEYEVLEPVLSYEDSMTRRIQIHPDRDNLMNEQHIVRGNADEAIKNSKYVITTHFETPYNEHAFMEPESAVCIPEGDDGVHLFCGDQGIYESRRKVSKVLGIPQEKFHVTATMVGGAFGAKNDMVVQQYAALMCWLTKRPVKMTFTRQESLQIHPKRPPFIMEFTTACDENGNLTATKARIQRDNGAYASAGMPVLQRACIFAAGPYHYENIDILGQAWYTNNPPGGAFRGFAVPQTAFCTELHLNKLAEMVGISPWEIRYRNAVRPGESLPNGQIMGDDCALVETLLAVKDEYDANPGCGIACGFKNSGAGVATPDMARCNLVVKDGKVHIRSAAACVGQGMQTVETQMVCETAGITPDKTIVTPPDTDTHPDSGMAIASRHTVFTGEACVQAAKKLKAALDAAGGDLSALEGQEFYGEFDLPTDPVDSKKAHPVSHATYSYATMLTILNDDDDKIKKFTAAVDAGRVVNPISAEGQLEGGVTMALGFVLSEQLKVENGLVTTNYGKLGLLRAKDVPELEIKFVNSGRSEFANGAKGCGEIATIPVASSVQDAYYRRTGVFQTKLPLDTPYWKHK